MAEARIWTGSDWVSITDEYHRNTSDPHLQYHTDARGDARYSPLGHAHAGVYDPAGTASAAIAAHLAAGDPHPGYLTPAEGNAAYEPINANIQSHISSTSNPHSVTAAQAGADPAGTASAAIAAHLAAADPHPAYALESALGGAAALNVGTGAGTVAAGNDSRLSDARTPTAHATSHGAGGADSIKLDDLAAPDDNTDLNATTGAHGLLPKLGGGTTNFLRADGAWAAPPGGGGGGAFYAVTVDFGTTPRQSKMFDATVTGATVGAKVLASASLDMPGSVPEDELEMDGLTCAARVVSADTVRIAVVATGPITGQRNINLTMG